MKLIISITDFMSGHNNFTGEESVNSLHTRFNSVKKRQGYDALPYSVANNFPVRGLHKYYKRDGDSFILKAFNDDVQYLALPDDWTSIIPDPPAALTPGEVHFLTFYDRCFFVNGSEAPFVWDGTGDAAYVAGIPAGWGSPFAPEYIAGYKLRIFYAQGNWLYFSEPGYAGSSADYDVNNVIKLSTDDGDVITGLVPHDDFLAIFKQNSVYSIFGSSPGDFEKPYNIHQRYGAIAPRSIVPVGPVIYFLHKEGLFHYNGSEVSPVPLSSAVENEIFNMSDNDLKKAAACLWRGYYILSFTPSGHSVNDQALIFNTLTGHNSIEKGWSIWTNFPSNCFVIENGIDDSGDVLFGNSADSDCVFRYPSGYKDGLNNNDIDFRLRKWLPRIGHMEREKSLYNYEIRAKGYLGKSTLNILDDNLNRLSQDTIEMLTEIGTVFDAGYFDDIIVGGDPDIGRLYEGGLPEPKAKKFAIEITNKKSHEFELMEASFEAGIEGEPGHIGYSGISYQSDIT